MPSQGALAFLLPKYNGIAKAKNILLRVEPIFASQAYDLGLVDKVIKTNDFVKVSLEFARELTHLAPEVIDMTRQLFDCNMKGLRAYFEKEEKLLRI